MEMQALEGTPLNANGRKMSRRGVRGEPLPIELSGRWDVDAGQQ